MPKKSKISKILFLQTFPLWGCGSGTYTRELVSEINNRYRNIKTAIVCPTSAEKISGLKIYPLEMPFPAAFTGHPKWPVCKLYKDLSPKEISEIFRFFLSSAVKAIDDFQPDLIHVQHISLLLWAANFAKAFYDINFIVTAHGTGVLAASQNKSFIPFSQDALKRARKIVAVSGDTKRWLLETFGKEFSYKTRIIPGGIDIEKNPPQKKIKIVNKKYKLKGKKVVLFSGKLTPQKGVYYILKAAKEIKGDIYIIGDGPEKKNLEDIKYKLKLDNVHFLGYMGDNQKEELKEFYYRADVFVAPSVWDEPLGLVILEAMSCKTPVIATRKGGIPLAIKNGINGILIRPRNSQQIAQACNKLLKDDKLREKMGEAARKTVEIKFTWEKIAKSYMTIYKKAYANNNHKKNGKNKNIAKKSKLKKGQSFLRIFHFKKKIFKKKSSK